LAKNLAHYLGVASDQVMQNRHVDGLGF